MQVLVTWGSKMGGTAGIARMLAEDLRDEFRVDAIPARDVAELEQYDAVIIGGALYANRWHRDARRFVLGHTDELRKMPVWMFSSGPLDDSAESRTIEPTEMVTTLMERVGAQGHATFGGRLRKDAKGFPASAMAKEHAGDWRNPDHIAAWARQIGQELPTAQPGAFVDHPASSLWRLIGYATLGWAACGAVMAGLLATVSTPLALALHAVAAPAIFAGVSSHYFAPRGARQPLPVALAFTLLVGLLDLVIVAGLAGQGLGMFASIAGTWLPFALIFLATWLTGATMSTRPWPEETKADRRPKGPTGPAAAT